MNPRPDDLPPAWLAAYADGELCPRDRARVERWLAGHPEARDLVDAQESLGRGNSDLWDAVRPPEPSPGAWAKTVRSIAAGTVSPARRWVGALGTAGLIATAATLLLALPGVDRKAGHCPLPPIIVPSADSDDDGPYVMAQDDDVRIVSLPEEAAPLLVVGAHPLGESMVVLAARDDLVVHAMGADPAGRMAEMFDDQDGAVVWTPKDE